MSASEQEFRALWHAAQQGNADVAQFLERSAFSRHQLAHAVRVAVWNDHAGAVTLLVAAANAMFTTWHVANEGDPRSHRYGTPLHLAALRDSSGVARALLCAKAEVDCPHYYDTGSCTPACIAAESDHVDVLEVLLQAGASVNRENRHAPVPLIGASRAGHRASVQLLCNAKADVDRSDYFGRTPLYGAASGGHAHIVLLLLEAGATLDHVVPQPGCSVSPRPTLLAAAWYGCVDVVRLLLSAKAAVDALDHITGETAVSAAAQLEYLDVLQVLLLAKADVHGITGPCAAVIHRAIEADRSGTCRQ